MKSTFAVVMLALAVFLTLWMIKLDRDVPGHYTKWGQLNMTNVFLLLLVRWVVLTVGFISLLRGRVLDDWGGWGWVRAILVVLGLFAMEVSGLTLHPLGLEVDVKQGYRTAYIILAPLLPLCVILSGFFASRALFTVGVIGAVVAAMYGSSGQKTFMAVERPVLGDLSAYPITSVLMFATPMVDPKQAEAALEQIEKRPNWREEVAGELDGNWKYNALFVLGRKADRLTPELEERAWQAAGRDAVEINKAVDQNLVGLTELWGLIEGVRGLAKHEGPLREKYRDTLLSVLRAVERETVRSPSTPELKSADWRVGGK